MLRHRRDVRREGVGASSVHERGDDDVVDGKREREKTARDNAGEKYRQLDVEERVPRPRTKIVRRLEPGELLAKAVEFNPIHIVSAEILSSQESAWDIPYEGPISEGKPYPKALQPVRFHSWAPIYVEYDPVERLSLEQTETTGDLGATLMFQNELGTAYGSIGVSLTDSVGFRPALHAQYIWQALGPIVELRADYNERNVTVLDYERVSSEKGMSFPEKRSVGDDPLLSISGGISLPFNLSSGGWRRGIIPSYRLTWCNDRISSLDVQQYTNSVIIKIVPHESLLLSKFSLRAYEYIWNARTTIFRAYGVTICVTLVGTVLNVLISALAAYPLSLRKLPGKTRKMKALRALIFRTKGPL